MTTSKYLRWSFGLFLAAAGALTWAGKPGANNTPPTVSLTTPANGASYTAPATITLAATAADSDGTIAKVEFFRGKKLIGASTAAPYGVTWSNVPDGSYSLTAKATDNGGAVATSPAVAITVTAPNNNVLISSPANGSTVYGGAVTVSGTFVGGTSTVWVDNGSSSRLAALNGNSYSAIVPLHVGSNTLTVTVARTDKTADKASVNVNGNLNPLLVFTAPSQTVHSAPANIALAVDAVSPSGTIGGVSFYRDGTLLGSVAAPPYQYNWTNVPAGSYTISATATDTHGQSGTASLPITVMGANILPSVGLTAPANGAVYSAPASITLQAGAADSDGTITSVEFLQNGTLLGGTNIVPYGLALTNVAAGSYAFTARATDNRGGVVTSSPVNVTVTPPNHAPVVNLTSPQANASYIAPASVALAATAADSDGTLSRVEFYAGNTLVATATTAPYTATWAVSAAGSYAITARAFDNLGASTVSGPVTVTVGDGVTYLHNDFAGNPIAATDSSGAVVWKENFRPYGDRLNNQAAAAGNRQWFHGKAVDGDTGLSYFGARYYDATLGRFIGVDPVGFKPENLHSFGRYSYANNNPHRFVDPDGNEAVEVRSPQWMRDVVPGQVMWDNARTAMANGDYGIAVGAGLGMAAEIGVTAATGGTAKGANLVAGQGGRFSTLAGKVGDDLTAHHMPQAALKFTSRAEGGAVVMTTAEHEATRTFAGKGARTAIQDAGKSFRDVLVKDIRDARSIVGTRYNEGLKDVIRYYKENFPSLMSK